MLDWYPEPAEPAYNKGGLGSVAWSIVCVALAAALTLSAVESSRRARDLDEQMRQLEQEIRQIEKRNAEYVHG